ncbi:phosphodiester glycosidase family protein [Erythrobacter alti]|uniref:phosphodiester glycosidase family protein n=1 Tax=Erythrobacter alti TaxID=1896145 RepID=UPI0030F42F96
MKRVAGVMTACLALTACEVHFEGEPAEELLSICQPVMFEDTPLTHCQAEPTRHAINTDLAPEGEDNPYRSLRAFVRHPREVEHPVVFAMNAGMFDAEGVPIGYYVEEGRRLALLNQTDGPGNFHLLPNGIFFGGEDGNWRVLETEAFAGQIKDRPHFATQSGPMLVINGELHPAFDPDGESRKIRNAVGVDASGRAHFVISEAPISFGKLARYYRDALNVDNALFLDGSVSQIWDMPNERLDTGPDIGPLIVVRNRAEAAE